MEAENKLTTNTSVQYPGLKMELRPLNMEQLPLAKVPISEKVRVNARVAELNTPEQHEDYFITLGDRSPALWLSALSKLSETKPEIANQVFQDQSGGFSVVEAQRFGALHEFSKIIINSNVTDAGASVLKKILNDNPPVEIVEALAFELKGHAMRLPYLEYVAKKAPDVVSISRVLSTFANTTDSSELSEFSDRSLSFPYLFNQRLSIAECLAKNFLVDESMDQLKLAMQIAESKTQVNKVSFAIKEISGRVIGPNKREVHVSRFLCHKGAVFLTRLSRGRDLGELLKEEAYTPKLRRSLSIELNIINKYNSFIFENAAKEQKVCAQLIESGLVEKDSLKHKTHLSLDGVEKNPSLAVEEMHENLCLLALEIGRDGRLTDAELEEVKENIHTLKDKTYVATEALKASSDYGNYKDKSQSLWKILVEMDSEFANACLLGMLTDNKIKLKQVHPLIINVAKTVGKNTEDPTVQQSIRLIAKFVSRWPSYRNSFIRHYQGMTPINDKLDSQINSIFQGQYITDIELSLATYAKLNDLLRLRRNA